MAAGSRSLATRLGRAASVAGVNSAVPAPARSASATVGTKPSTKTMPTNATARITSATTAHMRRDQRSATAPNTGPRSIGATRSAISTMLIAHGDSKRSYATSSSAT